MPLIRNFGRNVEFTPAHVYAPRNDDEVLEILRRHRGEKIRCRGGLHSWSRILETGGVLLDLKHYQNINVAQRQPEPRVRIDAGCTIGRVLEELERHGLTLPTVGAIKKQTIAGAISTGTHGSGKQSLSHFVQEVRLASYDATGNPVIARVRSGGDLRAARCALGGLGVILDVVISARETYRVRERFEKARSKEEALAGRAKWKLQQFFLVPWKWRYYVYRRKVTRLPRRAFCAALMRLWLLLSIDVVQHAVLKWVVLPLGAVRFFLRWTPILGHHRIDESHHVLTLRHDLFRHVEMEVFVPEPELRDAIDAIRAMVEKAAERGEWTHHYPIFFRYIEPEDTLLSMASGGETWVSISFFTYVLPLDDAFRDFAKAVAEYLVAKHHARLHWGKYFPLPFPQGDPRVVEFEKVRARYDPAGAFWNTNL
jgi:FAD/FMN-containing dehydrogenase